ncbi:MAG: hypothetical protein LUE12_00125 [Ruminococcus sp.]|nr:hypothetical protein [Ruminococcus sp.]
MEYNIEASLQMDESFNELEQISPYAEDSDMIDLFNASFNEVLYGKNDSESEAEILYEKIMEIFS